MPKTSHSTGGKAVHTLVLPFCLISSILSNIADHQASIKRSLKWWPWDMGQEQVKGQAHVACGTVPCLGNPRETQMRTQARGCNTWQRTPASKQLQGWTWCCAQEVTSGHVEEPKLQLSKSALQHLPSVLTGESFIHSPKCTPEVV